MSPLVISVGRDPDHVRGRERDDLIAAAQAAAVHAPKAPNAVSSALRRMATNLRAAGIEFRFSRNDERGRRVVSVFGAAQIGERPSGTVSSRE